jgi:hypothetical protein
MNARTQNAAAGLILRLLVLSLAPLTIAWPHRTTSNEAADGRSKAIAAAPLPRAF